MADKVSNLHQSENWEKAHVDIGREHGLSPTINPPREVDGVKELGGWKDLPSPYGPTPGFENDIRRPK